MKNIDGCSDIIQAKNVNVNLFYIREEYLSGNRFIYLFFIIKSFLFKAVYLMTVKTKL